MLQRIAVGSMLLLALALVALGVVLVMSSPQQSPALLVYPAIAGVYTVGAVGLHRHRRWGALVAGLGGIIGTLLTLVVLVFAAASVPTTTGAPICPSSRDCRHIPPSAS